MKIGENKFENFTLIFVCLTMRGTQDDNIWKSLSFFKGIHDFY